MQRAHVCDCFLDLATHLFMNTPPKELKRELVVSKFTNFTPSLLGTRNEFIFEWDGLVVCCPSFFTYQVQAFDIGKYIERDIVKGLKKIKKFATFCLIEIAYCFVTPVKAFSCIFLV